MSVMQAATAGPTCALKTSRTGSALPPIPSGWRCRRGNRRISSELESLGAIEVLAPGNEPDLVGVEIQS